MKKFKLNFLLIIVGFQFYLNPTAKAQIPFFDIWINGPSYVCHNEPITYRFTTPQNHELQFSGWNAIKGYAPPTMNGHMSDITWDENFIEGTLQVSATTAYKEGNNNIQFGEGWGEKTVYQKTLTSMKLDVSPGGNTTIDANDEITVKTVFTGDNHTYFDKGVTRWSIWSVDGVGNIDKLLYGIPDQSSEFAFIPNNEPYRTALASYFNAGEAIAIRAEYRACSEDWYAKETIFLSKSPPIITATPKDQVCYGATDGEVKIDIGFNLGDGEEYRIRLATFYIDNGGSDPENTIVTEIKDITQTDNTFSFDVGASPKGLPGLADGYLVLVEVWKNGNPLSLSSEATVEVGAATEIKNNSSAASNLICPSATTAITLSAIGGTVPYTYSAVKGPTGWDANTNACIPGEYTVRVTDNNLCFVDKDIKIESRPEISIINSSYGPPTTCFPTELGSISVTASNVYLELPRTTPTFTLIGVDKFGAIINDNSGGTIDGSNSTATFNPSPGNYKVSVSHSCSDIKETASLPIAELTKPLVSSVDTNIIDAACHGGIGQIELNSLTIMVQYTLILILPVSNILSKVMRFLLIKIINIQ